MSRSRETVGSVATSPNTGDSARNMRCRPGNRHRERPRAPHPAGSCRDRARPGLTPGAQGRRYRTRLCRTAPGSARPAASPVDPSDGAPYRPTAIGAWQAHSRPPRHLPERDLRAGERPRVPTARFSPALHSTRVRLSDRAGPCTPPMPGVEITAGVASQHSGPLDCKRIDRMK